jgi:ribosome assembly protein RRB1
MGNQSKILKKKKVKNTKMRTSAEKDLILNEEHQMDVVEDVTDSKTPETYLPSFHMEKDEILDFDATAYEMYHSMNVEWPCLSFAFLKNSLEMENLHFPLTTYMVSGTQADQSHNNKLWVMKWSQLNKMKHDQDSDESDEEDPILNYKELKLNAGVNRLKMMPSSQKSHVVALWLDSGHVSLYDITKAVSSLDSTENATHGTTLFTSLFTFTGHSLEGFALDWSSLISGRLVTGDCKKHIYLWNRHEAGTWIVDNTPFHGHTQSVEDLQWSPNEQELFASCSSDKTLKLWDARKKDKPVMNSIAHESDVNVLSWNR